MCWVAADRALQLADRIGASDEQDERWRWAREEIAGETIERAWNGALGAFAHSDDGGEGTFARCRTSDRTWSRHET
jgi:GH15 family glucan-1,4-alpha-glucosidase